MGHGWLIAPLKMSILWKTKVLEKPRENGRRLYLKPEDFRKSTDLLQWSICTVKACFCISVVQFLYFMGLQETEWDTEVSLVDPTHPLLQFSSISALSFPAWSIPTYLQLWTWRTWRKEADNQVVPDNFLYTVHKHTWLSYLRTIFLIVLRFFNSCDHITPNLTTAY